MQTNHAIAAISRTHGGGHFKNVAQSQESRRAILTVEPIPRKNRKPGATYLSGAFNARLIVDGHKFYSDDASELGIIAFVCNVATVTASTLNSPRPITLRANVNFHCALAVLDAFDERAFLEQFHESLYRCTHSRQQTRDFVNLWQADRFPLALMQVPGCLRINTKLERGVYDERGIPMSAVQIAHRARREKLMRELECAIQGKPPQLPSFLEIDFKRIIRHGGRGGKIAYRGDNELKMHRAINHFGFERIPTTWNELNGLLEYCKHLWMAAGQNAVPPDLINDWRKTGRNIDLKLNPWRVPAFDAYIAGDIEKLRAIHATDITLDRLAEQWRQRQIQREAG
jgi:hypothetical protein